VSRILVAIGTLALLAGCTTTNADGTTSSGIGSFLPLILILALLWLLLLRPQQKRAKNRRAMLEKLEVGDEVVTTSGLYCRIAEFDEGTVFVYVADGVRIKISRDSIAERITYSEE